MAQIIFLPLFAQYMLDNPGTSVEVLSISGHTNLFSESLDIAIWVGHQLRLPDSSFWSRWIGTFGRRLFASKAFLASHKKIQEPQQPSEHACIRLVQRNLFAVTPSELQPERVRKLASFLKENFESPLRILGGFGLKPAAPDADTRAWLRLKGIRFTCVFTCTQIAPPARIHHWY